MTEYRLAACVGSHVFTLAKVSVVCAVVVVAVWLWDRYRLHQMSRDGRCRELERRRRMREANRSVEWWPWLLAFMVVPAILYVGFGLLQGLSLRAIVCG